MNNRKNKQEKKHTKKQATRMGFEPTPAERNGLAVHRLNHSATSSVNVTYINSSFINTYRVNWIVHLIGPRLTKIYNLIPLTIREATQFKCIQPINSTHPG